MLLMNTPLLPRATAAAFAAALLSLPSLALAAPTPRECAAASEDALSLKKQEKLSATKDRLLVCADPACPAEVRDECARRMSEVTAAIPSVVFDVKDAAGNDVSAVRVTMDGALLLDHVGAAAVSIDPGEHTFRFEAAGQPPVEKKVVVREGEKNRHIDAALGGPPGAAPAAVPPGGAPMTPAPMATQPVPPQADQGEPSSWSAQKTLAIVVGGVGVVGIAVGSIFGAQAMSKWSDAKNQCTLNGAVQGCGPLDPAQSTKNDAQSAATISTAMFIVGGAGLVGGTILWFTAPSGAQVQVTPTAGPQSAGLAVKGVF
jgi:hypothetical protein